MLLFLSWIGMVHASGVVINEALVDPVGADSGQEWLELYNAGESEVLLAGWKLEAGTSSYRVDLTFDEGVSIAPKAFLVVGESSVEFADIGSSLSFGNAGSSADSIRLTNAAGEVVDTLVYGEPNTDEWLDDSGEIATSLALVGGAGASMARAVDGLDTDAAAADFVVLEAPTPGGSNAAEDAGATETDMDEDTAVDFDADLDSPIAEDDSATAPVDAMDTADAVDSGIVDSACETSVGIKINEVLANPAGPDNGFEWIELYNGGEDAVSLSGWQIEGGTSSLRVDVKFDSGVILGPDAYLVIGESSVAVADVVAELSLGNAGSSSDITRLVDCFGAVADTLVYGEPNNDEWRNDGGDVATSFAPMAPESNTIARLVDGVDSDASGADFAIASSPTPGAPNDFSLVESVDTAESVSGDEADTSETLVEDEADTSETLVEGEPGTSEPAPVDGADTAETLVEDGTDTAESPPVDGTDTAETLVGDATDTAESLPLDGEPIGSSCETSTGIKINEMLVDPDGPDDGHEWIELFNAGAETVNLDGWELGGGTSSVRTFVAFGSGISLAAGEYLLVGDEFVVGTDVVASISLGNAGSSADIVQLTDCAGVVADTLVYGEPNTDEWVDDGGGIATSLAPKPVTDHSLARIPDGYDTDAGAADFVVVAVPTPGGTNGLESDAGEGPSEEDDSGTADSADTAAVMDMDSGDVRDADTGSDADTGGPDFACSLSADIKINEALVDPDASSDDGHEWVEIYNRGTEPVNVHGWQLQGGTSSLEHFIEFDDVVIEPDAFLLVGGPAVSEKDVEAPLSLGNATADADIIQLMDCGGLVADTLIYGTPNSDEWRDDSGAVATSTAPAPSTGESIARSPDGADSDDAGIDFVVVSTPTPGSHLASSVDGADTGSPFAGCEVSDDVKINEVLADPDGPDGGFEWIELYNAGSDAVSLSGWQIEGGTSSLSVDVVFDPGAIIEPGGYFVVGESFVAGLDVVADLSLGNAGSSADITRLVDCFGAVADTLVYGEPNSDEWRNDRGDIAVSLALVAPESSTMARRVDGLDTDASAIDFGPSASPTPGAPNAFDEADLVSDTDPDLDTDDGPVVDSDCPGAASIKINEVMVDPGAEGGDDGHEWIELFNAGAETVNLNGWELGGGTSSVRTFVAFESGISLAPGEHLLVGDELVSGADVVASISLGNAGSSADIVQLTDCAGVVADTLVYGEPNTDEWVDDGGGIATSLAPKPGTDYSLARISDGYDTNACGTDFVASEFPTPGSANPSIEPIVCVEGAQQVKINEFMVDPDAALVGGEASDADLEWVELYNGSDAPVSLAGWKLQWGKNGTYPGAKVFSAGVSIAPGEWLLVGGSLVPDTDVTTSFDMGNASSSSDAVRLMDCAEVVQDTVIYGPNNDDGWLDDEDEVATSFAEAPGKEKSAARFSDGVDTEQSGMDFVVVDAPTPGAANAGGGGVTGCTPGDMDIKINEILPDPEGTDDGFEFIELFNTSDDDVSIEGWSIATGTSSWPSDPGYRFPAGASIPAGGFVVIAGNEVEGADFYTDDEEKFSLGNGSSAPDGVRLEDCAGDVQDTVLYGDPLDPIEDLELEDDQGLSSMATMPESNLSAGRTEDGVDTDDNAADFTTNMPPTPGESNAVRELSAESSKGCGCGGKSEGPNGGADGPMEAGALAGLISSLLLFVALRRREDQ